MHAVKWRKLITICVVFLFSISALGISNFMPTTKAVFGEEDIFFEYGAESGELEPPWYNVFTQGGGASTVEIETSIVHAGLKSVELTAQSYSSQGRAQCSTRAPKDNSLTEYYWSYWVYLPSNYDLDKRDYFFDAHYIAGGYVYNFRKTVISKSGGSLRFHYGWEGWGWNLTMDVPLGEWFHTQSYIKIGLSDGIYNFWVNDDLVLGFSNIDTATVSTTPEVTPPVEAPILTTAEIKTYLDGSETNIVTKYVDDVVLSSERVPISYTIGGVSVEFESWETGFESPISEDFNNTYATSGSSVARSSTLQYSGTYSGNFTSNGTASTGAQAFHVVQGTDAFFQRSHVYLDDLPASGNEISLLGSNNISGNYVNYVRVMQNGSGTYWILRVAQTPTDNDKVYYKDNILNDTWYEVEIYMKMGVSGNSTLWVNGSKILSVTGDYSIHGNLGNAYPQIWCDDAQGDVISVFHDDYRVDDIRIGGGTPIIFQGNIALSTIGDQDPLENVMINGTYPTDSTGYYELTNLTYNQLYTFVIASPIGYYPAWVLDVNGGYTWNGTHFLLYHNLTEAQTSYIKIYFFASSQTYIQSSNTTVSNVYVDEAFFETSHEDYLFVTVEGDTGETSSINVYIPSQGEPNAVYGASSYGFASLVLSVNVTHSSSATVQVVWTEATTWGGFNLFFQNGHLIAFQSEFTLTIEVTSGLLNATSGTLDMSEEQGTLRFTATNDSILSVTSPDAEGGFQISISGATETDHVGGFTYHTTISTGDTVTIWWGWRLESWADMYTLLGIGLGGVALMVASPTWVALELRKKIDADSLERLGYGVLLFIIGWGCVIIWLWS